MQKTNGSLPKRLSNFPTTNEVLAHLAQTPSTQLNNGVNSEAGR